MKKKIIIFILILSLAASIFIGGCTDKNEEKLRIVYLGDSICEGVAGMAPVSERERDAYFGNVAIRNGFEFKNRGISGFRSRQLLAHIKGEDFVNDDEDDGIWRTKSLIKTADIVHLSTLGNDIMLSNLGNLITSVAKGNDDPLNEIIDAARYNIGEIVKEVRKLNPTAVLIIQTVYNPVFGKNLLITPQAEAALAEMGIYEDGYRALASQIVVRVNAAIHQYLILNPGAFYIVDGFAEYDRIYREDPERGKDLVFVDDAHPSSEGHGVLSDLNQRLFEEIGLANEKAALKKYKEMRIEQIERLYSKRVDVKKSKKQINRAKSCEEVTELYYDIIDGVLPNYIAL